VVLSKLEADGGNFQRGKRKEKEGKVRKRYIGGTNKERIREGKTVL